MNKGKIANSAEVRGLGAPPRLEFLGDHGRAQCQIKSHSESRGPALPAPGLWVCTQYTVMKLEITEAV